MSGSGTPAPDTQPNGGQPANTQQPQPPIPPAQQQLNADLVQQAQALQQQVQQLQAQLNAQPIRMRELKLPEPKEFRGTKDKTPIREWLRDIEEIFTLAQIPMDHHTTIVYAAHYLTDDAKTWYKMHEMNINSWQLFRNTMIERYKDPREVDKARTRLMSMKQIGTVDNYTTAFDRATLEFTEAAGYAPRMDELVFMYREGLKPAIKTFLAARGVINDLKVLQEMALEIDAAMYNNRGSNNTNSSSTPSRVQHHKPNNHSSSYRPPYQSNPANRYSQNQRQFTHYRTGQQQFSRPQQFNQSSNRGYAPMDTSNAITQQRRQQLHQIDSRSNNSKPIKGNCFNCGKAGHFIKDCPTNNPQSNKQRTNVIVQEESSAADDHVLIISEVNSTQSPKPNKKLITFVGLVNDQPAYILIDSGATNNYISEAFVRKHRLYTEPIDEPTEAILANGISLNVNRMVPSIPIRIQDYIDEIDANVLALDKYDMVLSMAWLDAHGPNIDYRTKSLTFEHGGKVITLRPMPVDADVHTQVVKPCNVQETVVVKEPVPLEDEIKSIHYDRKLSLQVYTVHDKDKSSPTPMQQALQQIPKHMDKQYVSQLIKLVQNYIDVFPKDLPPGIPEHIVMHEIEFKPDAKPIKQRPYPLAPKYLPFVKETIDMLLSKGFIVRSKSPSQVPITIADKDGGKDYRFCIDYRAINAQTISDATPPPNIQMLFDQLQGATIFTKIDLRSAYWQVQVKPSDRWKTAFTCRYGHYEWTVMPFGLKNAPATFVKLMDEVFQDFLDKFLIVYLDDIVVYSKTLDEHLHHLERIFSRLREHKLYAKLEKCQFMQKQIKFLGHLVSAEGIRVNPEKVKAIVDWPTPKTVKDVRAFLGISGYYRKFIQNYSKVAAPLTELLKDEQQFKWREEQQSAFDLLKHATTSAPILAIPNMELPFKVTTDACSRAVGAVLSQNQGKGDQPIAYLSKKLTGAEQNWPAHEQELYAVVLALKHWKYYLLGSRFDVYTDSIALKTIMTQTNLSRKQFRWVMELQEFLPFNIIHVSGKKNIVADALSRNAYAMEVSNIYEALPIEEEEMKEELEELLRDQEATSSSTSSSLGDYIDEDEDTDTLIDRIREAYNSDPQATNIRNTQNENYRFEHDLIYFNNKLLVPNDTDIKESILKMCHDFKLAGHLGTAKTAELVKRYFYWNNIDSAVREYVLSCPYCQADKDTNQRKLGLLQSIEIPSRRWQVITVDFITALPEVGNGRDTPIYNAICVFVDKYSKMVHLAPCNKNITAPAFARLFMKEIIRLHGVPQRIISDRDTRFNSVFFRKFTEALNVDLAMSTAFHPQTDGQTERVNRILQEMLRHYVYNHHEEWVTRLPYAEFAINNSISASTGHTPFYLNYGEHPTTPLSNMIPDIDDVPQAADAIQKIQ
jgi:hypothetical protein